MVFVVVIACGIIRHLWKTWSQTRFELSYRKPRARSGDNYEHRNAAERTTETNLSVYYLHSLVRIIIWPPFLHSNTDRPTITVLHH